MKKSTVQQVLGRRIRNLRRAQNMSQWELATKCQLQIDFVKAIEKGKEDPSLEDLAKIAEVLEVDMFDLVRKQGKEDPARVKREILELIDEIKKRDKRNLQLILEILRALR